jgi:hypothetical protein
MARAAAQGHFPYTNAAKGELYSAYLGALLKCNIPTGERVEMVLAIGADGRVGAVYVDPLNRRTRCLQRTLRRTKLPPPPETPFFHSASTLTFGW